jgi:hypothetical protein
MLRDSAVTEVLDQFMRSDCSLLLNSRIMLVAKEAGVGPSGNQHSRSGPGDSYRLPWISSKSEPEFKP